eukprot:gene10599-27015_t
MTLFLPFLFGVQATATGARTSGSAVGDDSVNVLILYANDQKNSTGQLAWAVANGAIVSGANVRCEEIAYGNYERDVAQWADAVILGSGVYNGNADPRVLTFINTFDFMDDLSDKVGGAIATGGAAASGLEDVLEQIQRGLNTFRLVTVGGDTWQSAEGTGARAVRTAAAIKTVTPSPTPPPPSPPSPPCYDAGLVIVNFTTRCS